MYKQLRKILDLLIVDGKQPTFNSEDSAESLFKTNLESGLYDKLYKDVNYINYPNAHTLESKHLGYCEEGKFTIHALVHDDYKTWINFFVAVFDDGRNFVFGNFEHSVVASNKRSFNTLVKYCKPEHWSYDDI